MKAQEGAQSLQHRDGFLTQPQGDTAVASEVPAPDKTQWVSGHGGDRTRGDAAGGSSGMLRGSRASGRDPAAAADPAEQGSRQCPAVHPSNLQLPNRPIVSFLDRPGYFFNFIFFSPASFFIGTVCFYPG